jgi:hypothetical protein
MFDKYIPSSSLPLFLLKCFTFCVLIGRAYQGFFFDLPLRTFFWDESLLSSTVTYLTQDSWENYVTNRTFDLDGFINILSLVISSIWATSAFAIFFVERGTKTVKVLLWLSGTLLLLLSVLLWKDNYYAMAQLLEQMTQVSMPFLILALYPSFATPQQYQYNTSKFRTLLILIIGFTFCSHGLYAVGYYPTSGAWVQWCYNMLPLSNDKQVFLFLQIMGVLDFLAVLFLFFKPTRTIGIYYCIAWGFITALTRILANFYWDIPWVSLHDWTYQTIFRLAHGGLPLILWLLYKNIPHEQES